METWQLVNYFYDKYLDEITNDFLLKSDRNCSVEERLYPEIKINYLLENRFELMVENTHLKSNKEKKEAIERFNRPDQQVDSLSYIKNLWNVNDE